MAAPQETQLPNASPCFKVYYIYFGSYFIINLRLTMLPKEIHRVLSCTTDIYECWSWHGKEDRLLYNKNIS